MNCIIVDDDDLIRMEVEQMIKKIPFLTLVGKCSNALDAFEMISSERPDLVFLDVMMPGMTGLELMECLSKNMPQVILMTLKTEFALKAFDYEVTDFLAKPISQERLLKAAAKAKQRYDQEAETPRALEYIFIKVGPGPKLMKIKTSDILYLESDKDRIHIYTVDGQHTVQSTMKSLLDKLPQENFMRVHNSFAVNLLKINSIEESTIVIGQKFIPIGRMNKEEFMKRLNMV